MAHGPAKGFTRWLYTTNHKDIGSMYLWFSFAMFLLGGVFALVIRAELFEPGLQIVEPEFFNQMTTMHGCSSTRTSSGCLATGEVGIDIHLQARGPLLKIKVVCQSLIASEIAN